MHYNTDTTIDSLERTIFADVCSIRRHLVTTSDSLEPRATNTHFPALSFFSFLGPGAEGNQF